MSEIRRDARVSLLYFDPVRLGYVTLVGRAVEISESERPKHHKPEWQNFFPKERPQTYLLYRVIPERLEVSSPRDGLAGDPVTWRPEIVIFP